MNSLRNMSVRKKLALLIVFASCLTVAIGIIGFIYMKDMARDTKAMYEEQLKPIQTIGKLRTNNKIMDSYMLEAMLSEDKSYSKHLVQNIDTLVQENFSMEKPEIFIPGVVSSDDYVNIVGKFSEVRKHALDLAAENKNREAYNYYVKEVKPVGEEFDAAVNKLSEAHDKAAAQVDKENDAKVKKANMIFFIVILVGIYLLVSFGITIAVLITRPLRAVQDLMKNAADGDLTHRGEYLTNDELGQLNKSYNNMIESMKDTIGIVSENAEMVVASSAQLSASAEQSTQASTHIASTIQDLAQGSEQQLISVEESDKAIKEITNYAKQINENMGAVTESASVSTEMSAAGEEKIREMISQMETINSNVSGLGEAVQRLNDRSAEIGNINSVITSIADQTNLLALNAAIEAARAGEHGKGFAVVADEVRKLAEQSVQSADQIKALISTIQDETREALASMDETIHGVETGIQVARTAGESFSGIENSIQEVAEQFGKVAEAINQLTDGSVQVAASIEKVKEVAETAAASSQTVSAGTEEQLASMEEIETSANSLAEVSDELQHAVRKFQI